MGTPKRMNFRNNSKQPNSKTRDFFGLPKNMIFQHSHFSNEPLTKSLSCHPSGFSETPDKQQLFNEGKASTSVNRTIWLGKSGLQNPAVSSARSSLSYRNASEMLVAPRIPQLMLWSAMVCHSLPWSVKVCCCWLDLLWSACVCLGLPWSTLICLGLLRLFQITIDILLEWLWMLKPISGWDWDGMEIF